MGNSLVALLLSSYAALWISGYLWTPSFTNSDSIVWHLLEGYTEKTYNNGPR